VVELALVWAIALKVAYMEWGQTSGVGQVLSFVSDRSTVRWPGVEMA
jgi:hypothetical protein